MHMYELTISRFFKIYFLAIFLNLAQYCTSAAPYYLSLFFCFFADCSLAGPFEAILPLGRAKVIRARQVGYLPPRSISPVILPWRKRTAAASVRPTASFPRSARGWIYLAKIKINQPQPRQRRTRRVSQGSQGDFTNFPISPYSNSISGCLSFTLKICQTVAGTCMIRQFHEFFKISF